MIGEYGFTLTRIFLYKEIVLVSVLIREYMGQRKPTLWYNLGNGYITLVEKVTKMIDAAINKYSEWFSYNLL